MERDEMIRYIEFLQERLNEEKRARELSVSGHFRPYCVPNIY